MCDDIELKTNLATELASNHGKKVLLEAQPFIATKYYVLAMTGGSRIIINTNSGTNNSPLLPIPNMSEPINMITVSTAKKLSRIGLENFYLPKQLN